MTEKLRTLERDEGTAVARTRSNPARDVGSLQRTTEAATILRSARQSPWSSTAYWKRGDHPRPADILALHGAVGNRTVQRLLASQVGRQSREEAEMTEHQQNRTGLPDALKSGIEALSGISMDDVRVHFDSPRPAQLRALAHTQGTEIYLGPGQERHLPHEAWHVVQQKEGRVRPTTQMKDSQINDDAGLEREADVMGARAVQSGLLQTIGYRSHAAPNPSQPLQRSTSSNTIQRLHIGDDADDDDVRMDAAASHIQGASTHSVTAIAEQSDEDENTSYVVYAQATTAGMQGRIDQYDNLEVGALAGGTGFHAEVLALQASTDYTWVAASQAICARCEALLDEQDIGALNTDGHFTALWSAPWDNEIDEDSPYPYGADGGGGTGLNGSRWGFADGEHYLIDRDTWRAAHEDGW